ncbi:MAG: hypothetical protein DMG76_30680, partial [Acidobacteria bacterium]
QLGNAKSLREICGGLAASEGKLRHLGLPQAPARATLAYANKHRPWQSAPFLSGLRWRTHAPTKPWCWARERVRLLFPAARQLRPACLFLIKSNH